MLFYVFGQLDLAIQIIFKLFDHQMTDTLLIYEVDALSLKFTDLL